MFPPPSVNSILPSSSSGNKNLSTNSLEIEIGDVHGLAMMLHHPPTKKLEVFVVLNEQKVRKIFKLHELVNNLLSFSIGP